MEIVIPLLIVLVPIAYQVWQYLDQRKRELHDKRFENFHRLIHDLVEPSDKGSIYIDRQIAVVFELRNFPEYAEVTERILNGLRTSWAKNADRNARLLAEMDLTLNYLTINGKSKKSLRKAQ